VPPDGATKVGSKPSTALTAWRNKIKELREKAEKARERASAIAK
jgi:hypothetical protein